MGFFDWFRSRKIDNEVRTVAMRRVANLLEMQGEDQQDEWQQLVERSAAGNVRYMKRGVSETDGNTVIVNTKGEGVGWEILGSAYKGHVGQDQQVMIAQARRFFRFDPNCQAAIFGMVEYLMGRGITITPKSKDPRIWKLWRNFWTSPENKMGIRQFEIVKRLFRDGEVLLRYFTKDGENNLTPFSIVRFLDPIDLRRGANEANDITDKTAQGIVFDENDAEKPLKYYFRKRNNPQEEDVVDAEQVQHVKFPTADIDQPRGESAMQAVMDLFTHYKQWLKNRIILNKLRTAIFAVREIDMDSAQSVSQLAQTLPTSGRASSNESKKMNIRPGTLYTPPPGVKIRMESANINASDVKEDGRNMILQMAAGTGLPEYMFGDASNANYSSTMMSESPFVKRIHFFQSYLEETLWRPMFRRVIEAAVAAGKLTAPADDDIFASTGDLTEAQKLELKPSKNGKNGNKPDAEDDAEKQDSTPMSESELEVFYGCDVEWPEIIHREPKDQTEALVLARNEGWISDKTASEKLGFDYGEEVRKQQQIEDEAEAAGNPLLQHDAGSVGAHQEEQDALAQQSQEEKMAATAALKGKGGK